MGKYANGKSRKHHESCESCASILKSLCFFGTKIQFCSEPQKGTTGDHERNDLRGKCFETTQKNIKKRTDFRCVKKCKQKGTRRILECRPPCRLNSASFLLRRTPSQHRNTLGASLQKSVSISSFLLLFTLPNSFSLHLSLSLSLPNALESCHWIAFHRFHASSLGALIGHLSIQLQLKLSFRVHRWHSPPSSCRSVESLTNLQKQSNSSKPRRFDFDHSPLPLLSCVQTLEQTFNLSKIWIFDSPMTRLPSQCPQCHDRPDVSRCFAAKNRTNAVKLHHLKWHYCHYLLVFQSSPCSPRRAIQPTEQQSKCLRKVNIWSACKASACSLFLNNW